MTPHDDASARKIEPLKTVSESIIAPETLRQANIHMSALFAAMRQEAPDQAPPFARRDLKKLLRWFIVSDALALLLSYVCAWGLAALINFSFFDRTLSPQTGDFHRLLQFALIAGGVILWFEHTGHYRVRMPFWLETKKVVGTISIALVIDGFLQFAAKDDFSRLWLVGSWMIAGFLIIIMRATSRRARRREGVWDVSTLLIGSGATADEASAALRSEPELGYRIVGQVRNLPQAFAQAGESWDKLCAQYRADYIVIALDGPDLADAELALAQLMREAIPFSVSPPVRHLPVLGMTPQYFFNHDAMLLVHTNRLEQPMPRFIKRAFDVTASGLTLLLLLPLLLPLATVIKADGGPVLYRQRRLGLNGKPFSCYKFRSMVVNSEAALQNYLTANPNARKEWETDQKLRHDPRITRWGDFLRRSSLDEIPQLYNVLCGDMSLVGPRPIVMAETGKYEDDIAHYYRVRPGLTGLWQVSGRNNISYSRRVQMDSWYVRNWSLWHDIAIICKTFPVLLNRTGAF